MWKFAADFSRSFFVPSHHSREISQNPAPFPKFSQGILFAKLRNEPICSVAFILSFSLHRGAYLLANMFDEASFCRYFIESKGDFS